ncbi:hypothetical protein [Flavobacterium sp.]|uniref:hypothetical protein n=1 Tax=Flavobacterium sp. TaxID=239 RepID=UPI00391DFB1F
MKSLSKIIPFISLLIIIIPTLYIVKEWNNSKKYENTKLNITISELKQDWGKPDYDWVNINNSNPKDKSRVLKYKFWYGYYIFKTDTEGKKITQKFMDD